MSAGYGGTRIPKRFWGKKLEDYEITKGNTRAVQEVGDYIANIEQHKEQGKGLTLLGPPGVGKTMLMSIIGMAAHDAGYRVMYLPLAVYVKWLLNMISWQDWATAETDWEDLRQKTLAVRNTIDFLLLDDVGKEHRTNTQFAEDEFDFLVRLRYDRAKPTIMTSNTPLEKWTTQYSSAMESFIHEAAPPVEMAALDYRKR
jgi:DNA replication protein DnaC